MNREKHVDEKIMELIALYEQTSKHSNYQTLPPQLQNVIPEGKLHTRTRYEKERMDYITKKLDLRNAVFCDIGCNCGYFSFEALRMGAEKGVLYEGNQAHAEFVKIASEILNCEERLTVIPEYFTFGQNEAAAYDVGFLLNVLHHVGDDYGTVKSMEDAKRHILKELNSMASCIKKLVFQMGFNWMGDRNQCLFADGTKEEMIRWLEKGSEGVWSIGAIGVAVQTEDGVSYRDLNEENIARMDELGEFLNRPVFIMENIK